MFNIKNFKKKIKDFKENIDYSIEWNGENKTYTFYSPKIKKVLWETQNIDDRFVYKVEERNDGFRAYRATSDFKLDFNFNNNFSSEEFGIYHEKQLTPDDKFSSSIYVLHRKQERDKIFEKKNSFQLLEENSEFPKIMEISSDSGMMKTMETNNSLVVQNFEKEKDEMIELRKKLNTYFSEEKKKEMMKWRDEMLKLKNTILQKNKFSKN